MEFYTDGNHMWEFDHQTQIKSRQYLIIYIFTSIKTRIEFNESRIINTYNDFSITESKKQTEYTGNYNINVKYKHGKLFHDHEND